MPSTSDFFPPGFEIDLDDDWIAVPRTFPGEGWSTAQAWADDVAAQAYPDDPDLRAGFASIAMSLTAPPPAFVDGVLWYAPRDGGPMGVAFLTVSDHEPDITDADGWAMLGIQGSLTPPQLTRHDSVMFGQIIQSATTFFPDREADGETAPGEQQPVTGRIRTVGLAPECVFFLEAVSTNLPLLARMQPDMVHILDAIHPARAEPATPEWAAPCPPSR